MTPARCTNCGAPVEPTLTRSQRQALVRRPDLVAHECRVVREGRITWAGRLHELGSYGQSGGSAGDRRLIVEAFAALEAVER